MNMNKHTHATLRLFAGASTIAFALLLNLAAVPQTRAQESTPRDVATQREMARRRAAETDTATADAPAVSVHNLQERVKQLEEKNSKLQKENDQLKARIAALSTKQ